jgi:DNA-binding response OmpR family regulator
MAHKVLVVDDEEDIVELLSYNLQLEGYEVFRAASGMEALNQARLHLPDLILLDLMLPDMDGFSICEILHCQPSTTNIPVIMLTAMAGELPRLHGFEVGAADYCIKPFRPRDLKARVKSVLETCAAKAAESEGEMEGVLVR